MKKLLLLLALPILVLNAPLQAADAGAVKIIKFEADWCGPCQQMKPIFAAVSENYGPEVTFQSIDIDEQPSVANSYHVQLLPTVVAVKDGKVVGRATGLMSAGKLKAFIKKHQ